MYCKYRYSLYMHDINNNHIYCNPAEKETNCSSIFSNHNHLHPLQVGRVISWAPESFNFISHKNTPKSIACLKFTPDDGCQPDFCFDAKWLKWSGHQRRHSSCEGRTQKFRQEEVNCLTVYPISQCVHAEYVVYRKKYSLDKNIR